MKFYLFLIFLSLLAGCTTTPTEISEASTPPANRVLASLPVTSAAPSYLTVIRDSGLHGAEHVFEISVNGTLLVELRQGEKFSTPVNPGTVFIEAQMHNILGSVPPVQVETIFAPGKTYVYRVGLDELTLRLLRDLKLSK